MYGITRCDGVRGEYGQCAVNTNEENQIATDGVKTEDTDETAEAEAQTENIETDIYEAERK